MTQETAETAQESQSQETVRIGDKVYLVESLTEEGLNLVADIRKTESVIAQQQLGLSVSTYAKSKLIEELSAMTDDFTEIEIPTSDS